MLPPLADKPVRRSCEIVDISDDAFFLNMLVASTIAALASLPLDFNLAMSFPSAFAVVAIPLPEEDERTSFGLGFTFLARRRPKSSSGDMYLSCAVALRCSCCQLLTSLPSAPPPGCE